ncbi:hypothetical protein DFH29DRAFT_881231 [Suillus ampliporus]|nr:hypothetical protein DFH29DRAFT_881231 [Suillus ampliporus]
MSNVEGSTLHVEGSMPHIDAWQGEDSLQPEQSKEVITFVQARQRRRIAELEEKLEAAEVGRAAKERAVRHVIALFNNIEDLVTENDRRSEHDDDQDTTLESATDRLWKGADGARGDDTSKLKTLVADWVNCELKPNPPVDSNDKYPCGFTSDACGRLLCPAELDWKNPDTPRFQMIWRRVFSRVKFLFSFKAVFTSPSSAKDVDGDGDGADVIKNNRRARKSNSEVKVKKHVAQIIKMKKVTPRSIAYITCQHRVNRLLEWWTRKIFGRSHRGDLSSVAKANMSVNALARQRAQRDDTAFDST